ncbi:MAG: hybrid sensor histidine kinase/response regulator [Methylacidiphilales bacterium]|nr:hybrid sensor histidine kinase/response regulator [Candidatus Methylacidiphilales bacterium]
MNAPTPPTILIADDHPTNLNVLFEYLSAQGYRVLVAEDGRGAIEQAQYGQPDLILLDVMMPGMDGFETCEKLKVTPETREIPVIFMTAISETAYVLRGFSVGGVDYITKPLQREEVLVRVRNHISIRLLQRELKAEIAVRQKAEQELREINAGKDVFFSVLAHDLKNPMGGMLGLSEAMVDTMPPETDATVRDMAVEIRNTARQVGDLLFDLLGWAQMQLGKMEPKPERISILKQIEFAVALVSMAAKAKKIKIENEVREPISIYCDVRMNDTVLRNLLSNAVKFTPAGGTIRISAEKKERELVITVTDSGRGIPPERLPGLFRLGESKTTFGTLGEKGTGLGLPLSREMVEKNKGRIWAESTPGHGSSFHFTVPLVSA